MPPALLTESPWDVRRTVEPGPSVWDLPAPDVADSSGLVAIGADLEPSTLLGAYRAGMFPMPLRRNAIGWWSPDPRGIIPLDGLRVSRSLRRSCRRYEIRYDTCFRTVVERCGDPSRPNGWITREFVAAYGNLHELGWAHSAEAFDGSGSLVGGLYGVAIGRLFAGESMFHSATDASKVALVALVDVLRAGGTSLLDVQWTTPHLRSLGAVDIPRREYLCRLEMAVSAAGASRAP